jgi:hypothetical protein
MSYGPLTRAPQDKFHLARPAQLCRNHYGITEGTVLLRTTGTSVPGLENVTPSTGRYN